MSRTLVAEVVRVRRLRARAGDEMQISSRKPLPRTDRMLSEDEIFIACVARRTDTNERESF